MRMFEQAFKNIDDVLRKEAGSTTELDYTEQTSWLLFLKYLDGLEHDRAAEAAMEGKKYSFILEKEYRWENWAAPKGTLHGEAERLATLYHQKLAALDASKKSLWHYAFSGELQG